MYKAKLYILVLCPVESEIYDSKGTGNNNLYPSCLSYYNIVLIRLTDIWILYRVFAAFIAVFRLYTLIISSSRGKCQFITSII